MARLHVQPWGVPYISMANNMTYESKGDIQPPPPPVPPPPPLFLSLPLHHGSQMGNRSLCQGQICLWWFGYQERAQSLPLQFPSQRDLWLKINYTDRYGESFVTIWFTSQSMLWWVIMMKCTINCYIHYWIIKKRFTLWWYYHTAHSVVPRVDFLNSSFLLFYLLFNKNIKTVWLYVRHSFLTTV